MSKHRMPRRRSPLNRTAGAGFVVAGGIALGAVGLIAPATASADFSVGGQNNSPGAAGGNVGGSTGSNNVISGAFGGTNVTTVNQRNGNYRGGNGNTSVHVPVTATSNLFSLPNFQFGGQNNSPGAAGGNVGGSALSNNVATFGAFNGSFTQVVQRNGNFRGGNNNTSVHIPIIFPAP
ncbi:hypothetical protein [Mycolicibacterium gadium]|uniref:hypothetical protein n=1 Tax=Mycolicibacterium gadium TaxID=1794 RepID=UPI002FDC83AD